MLINLTRFLFLPILVLFLNNIIMANNKENFLTADFVEYHNEENLLYAKGNVVIYQDKDVIVTDDLLLDVKNDLIFAKNDVFIYDNNSTIISGNNVLLRRNSNKGLLTNFIVQFDDDTLVTAELAKQINHDRTNLYNANFTPCKIVCGYLNPIWEIGANKAKIDLKRHRMEYQHVFFKVYGVPIFYMPYFLHPTPNSPARSGILTPSITMDNLRLPFYYRAKSNLDFTFAPNISNKLVIYELELRHKIKNGEYIIQNNFGEVPYKNKHVKSNYFLAKGDFENGKYTYGFNLNFASNKAFIKNHYRVYNSYLMSRMHLQHIENYNYFLVQGLHFRDLTPVTEALRDKNPLILPQIQTNNTIDLTEDKSNYLKISTSHLIYNQENYLKLMRNSVNASVTQQLKTNNGQLLNINLESRGDIYIYDKMNANNYTSRSSLARIIPQLQVMWRYPLTAQWGEDKNILLEPIMNIVAAPNHNNRSNKFGLIDPSIYELSEDNIFSPNRFSGIDYHESGKRISYGINSALLTSENYMNLFVGQLKLIDNKLYSTDAKQNIGSAKINFSENIGAFYKYRKGPKFSSIRDEGGFNLVYDGLKFTTSFVSLKNIKKYYFEKNTTIKLNRNYVKQGLYNFEFDLTDKWSIGNSMQFEVYHKKPRLIYKSIKVTYLNDCVKVTALFYDDYTYDNDRGIKKISSKSFKIGLKVLNM